MAQTKSMTLRNSEEISNVFSGSLLKFGHRGNAVATVQSALALLGYDLSHSALNENQFDGVLGSGTQATIEEFQKHQRIADDGIVGPTTIGRIDNDAHFSWVVSMDFRLLF